jgi:hypothetical protein
MKEEGV